GYGQLGDQTGTTHNVPVAAAISNAIAIASGSVANHSAALVSDGTLWTWGRNDLGQLGDGTRATNVTPKPVPNFMVRFIDSDRDGLSDAEEAQLGTDPHNADTNGDGISDAEAIKLGISATNMDMDGDGVSNAAERAAGTNPFLTDTDGD